MFWIIRGHVKQRSSVGVKLDKLWLVTCLKVWSCVPPRSETGGSVSGSSHRFRLPISDLGVKLQRLLTEESSFVSLAAGYGTREENRGGAEPLSEAPASALTS